MFAYLCLPMAVKVTVRYILLAGVDLSNAVLCFLNMSSERENKMHLFFIKCKILNEFLKSSNLPLPLIRLISSDMKECKTEN